MSLEAEAEANALLDETDTARTAYPLAAKLSLSARITGFVQAKSGELPQWLIDQLDAAANQMNPGSEAGTASKPNSYTTGAAAVKKNSFANELFSVKGLNDLAEGAKNALGEIGKGFTKGLANSALKLGVGAALIAGVWVLAKKKGWL